MSSQTIPEMEVTANEQNGHNPSEQSVVFPKNWPFFA
jgi:hypothetical protein